MKPVRVKCYSGQAYADRPVSFTLEGIACGIEGVEREWYEPGTKHFHVRTADNRQVELCYSDQSHEWSMSDPGGKEPG